MAVIGKKLVGGLRPKERPYEIRDERLTGFLVRVQPSGYVGYYVELGRGKRLAIGKADRLTPAQARDKATEYLAEAALGGDPVQARKKDKSLTLAEFVEREYAATVRESHRHAAETLRQVRSFTDIVGKKLADINAWDVKKHRTKRLKLGVKPSSVNREVGALRGALSAAVEAGLLADHPLAKLKPLEVDRRPRVRYLSLAEETRLRQALERRESAILKKRESANKWRRERGYQELPEPADRLQPLVLLSLNTGLRRGEAFNLEWRDVDLHRRVLTVQGTGAKSGQTRHIPLNRECLTVLTDWRARTRTGHGLVFPAADGGRLDNVRKSWGAVVKAAGLKRFRWHDLRHDFASKLAMAGVNLNVIRELLGHSDIKQTIRYAHLQPGGPGAAAVETLGWPKKGKTESESASVVTTGTSGGAGPRVCSA